jgi:hypothetical protein
MKHCLFYQYSSSAFIKVKTQVNIYPRRYTSMFFIGDRMWGHPEVSDTKFALHSGTDHTPYPEIAKKTKPVPDPQLSSLSQTFPAVKTDRKKPQV